MILHVFEWTMSWENKFSDILGSIFWTWFSMHSNSFDFSTLNRKGIRYLVIVHAVIFWELRSFCGLVWSEESNVCLVLQNREPLTLRSPSFSLNEKRNAKMQNPEILNAGVLKVPIYLNYVYVCFYRELKTKQRTKKKFVNFHLKEGVIWCYNITMMLEAISQIHLVSYNYINYIQNIIVKPFRLF